MVKVLPYLSALFMFAIGVAYYYDFQKSNKEEKNDLKKYFIFIGILVLCTFIFMLVRFLLKHKS
ncbi:MAG: hypothetical protein WCP57_09370 [Bacteroidota bacterium]